MSRKHTNAAAPAAVRWFHRFRVKGLPELSPDEAADWARWSADDTHLDEFCRVKQLWEKLEVLSVIARPLQEELAADEAAPEKSLAEHERGRPVLSENDLLGCAEDFGLTG
jgi:ferric-dicitrate binding protein FerR (iron transport regulator)